MKTLAIIAITLTSFTASAQQIQQEINEQVWKPFMQAFGAFDTESFMDVHSKDIVRAPIDGQAVLNFEQYKAQVSKGNNQSLSLGNKRTIDLRFITRIANKNQAYEIGIYHVTAVNNKGESQHYYGKFHVVLRKESDRWKILVDADSSEGNTIDEGDFIAAQLVE